MAILPRTISLRSFRMNYRTMRLPFLYVLIQNTTCKAQYPSCIVICYRIIWWNLFSKTVTHIIVAVVHNMGLSVDVAQRTTPSALSGTSRLCCVSFDSQFHLPLVDVLALGKYCIRSALATSWKLHYAFIEWELLRIKFVGRKCESTKFTKHLANLIDI